MESSKTIAKYRRMPSHGSNINNPSKLRYILDDVSSDVLITSLVVPCVSNTWKYSNYVWYVYDPQVLVLKLSLQSSSLIWVFSLVNKFSYYGQFSMLLCKMYYINGMFYECVNDRTPLMAGLHYHAYCWATWHYWHQAVVMQTFVVSR